MKHTVLQFFQCSRPWVIILTKLRSTSDANFNQGDGSDWMLRGKGKRGICLFLGDWGSPKVRQCPPFSSFWCLIAHLWNSSNKNQGLHFLGVVYNFVQPIAIFFQGFMMVEKLREGYCSMNYSRPLKHSHIRGTCISLCLTRKKEDIQKKGSTKIQVFGLRKKCLGGGKQL